MYQGKKGLWITSFFCFYLQRFCGIINLPENKAADKK
jgi:hypothetical protein